MTKEITKAHILNEIQDKFGLREFAASKFLFDETVVPTYDIGTHVKKWISERHRVAITANGVVALFNMVPTEKIKLRRITFMHEAGANFDVDQIYLHSGVATLHDFQYLFYDTTSPIASGTVKIFEFPQDIPVEDKMLGILYINVSNFVAGGYVAAHVLKEVETII